MVSIKHNKKIVSKEKDIANILLFSECHYKLENFVYKLHWQNLSTNLGRPSHMRHVFMHYALFNSFNFVKKEEEKIEIKKM